MIFSVTLLLTKLIGYITNEFIYLMELHPFQTAVLEECTLKKKGGLSLPMGSGKTIISLKLAFQQKKQKKPILVIASKTLLCSWEQEISKWFTNTRYKILNLEESFEKDCDLYLSTPTTLVKFYKKYNIEKYLIDKRRDTPFGPEICYYNDITKPVLKVEYDTFYSVSFSCLIVDEAHNFLNIETLSCRSICSINAHHKWLLSGTLFCEPKNKNILGFLRMCDLYSLPNNLPGLKKTTRFDGLKNYIVLRENNEMFVNRPKLFKTIIKYSMNEFETKIYTMYRNIIKNIQNKLERSRMIGDKESVKQLNACLLALITKLRLCMVSPFLPLSKMYLDNINNEDTEIYKTITDTLEDSGGIQYLEDENNLYSTRITKIIDKIRAHPDERILVFSSFRMSINYLKMLIEKAGIDRKIYSIESSMSVHKREEVIAKYSSTDKALLLMTYNMGAEGLNLQSTNIVMLMDFWWNDAKSKQAVARVYRYGQTKDTYVYAFVSNTYIESIMFEKHMDKSNLAEEFLEGNLKTKVKSMSMKKIMEILHEDEFCDKTSMMKSL